MLRALLYLFFICDLSFGYAQCLKISGRITDAQSGKFIAGALIKQKLNGKENMLSETKTNGLFQINLSCDAKSVLIEAEGYRPQTFAVNYIEKKENESFFLPVSLVAVDKLANDRPYFQQEQKQVTLSKNAPENEHTTTRVFEVLDALSGQRIEADLCLFYTKISKKDCQKIAAKGPGYEVSFRQTDIVAIEVRSTGYDSYFGNLIMDKLDGKKSTYQIRLGRKSNILSVTVHAGSQKVNAVLISEKTIPMLAAGNGFFFANVTAQTTYKLVINQEGKVVFSKTITTMEGLNLYSLATELSIKPTSQISSLSIASSVSIHENNRVLYFDRSDYSLRNESRLTLDTLAAWLQRSESHYLSITGHTDNVGPSQRNDILSEYRAKVAYNYLLNKGITPGSMIYRGIGSQKPELPNDVESNKERNRRVEIQLLRRRGI